MYRATRLRSVGEYFYNKYSVKCRPVCFYFLRKTYKIKFRKLTKNIFSPWLIVREQFFKIGIVSYLPCMNRDSGFVSKIGAFPLTSAWFDTMYYEQTGYVAATIHVNQTKTTYFQVGSQACSSVASRKQSALVNKKSSLQNISLGYICTLKIQTYVHQNKSLVEITRFDIVPKCRFGSSEDERREGEGCGHGPLNKRMRCRQNSVGSYCQDFGRVIYSKSDGFPCISCSRTVVLKMKTLNST